MILNFRDGPRGTLTVTTSAANLVNATGVEPDADVAADVEIRSAENRRERARHRNEDRHQLFQAKPEPELAASLPMKSYDFIYQRLSVAKSARPSAIAAKFA